MLLQDVYIIFHEVSIGQAPALVPCHLKSKLACLLDACKASYEAKVFRLKEELAGARSLQKALAANHHKVMSAILS